MPVELGTHLVLWEVREPLGIVMRRQDYPTSSSRIESVDQVGELYIPNRRSIGEGVLYRQSSASATQ